MSFYPDSYCFSLALHGYKQQKRQSSLISLSKSGMIVKA